MSSCFPTETSTRVQSTLPAFVMLSLSFILCEVKRVRTSTPLGCFVDSDLLGKLNGKQHFEGKFKFKIYVLTA